MTSPIILHVSSGDAAKAQALGPYRIETLIAPREEIHGTAYRVRIEPFQRTSVSYHKVAEEFYFVVAGTGTALLDGKEYPLKTGDFLRLPPGTTHGFVTEKEPLEMLDIHTPSCRPDHGVYFLAETPPGFGGRYSSG
jgi:mannose-6-phosphate isomerase-like protein (cupin superfamily)